MAMAAYTDERRETIDLVKWLKENKLAAYTEQLQKRSIEIEELLHMRQLFASDKEFIELT